MKSIRNVKWTRRHPDTGYYLPTTRAHGSSDWRTTFCGVAIPHEDDAEVSDCGYIDCSKCLAAERHAQAEERRAYIDELIEEAAASSSNAMRHGLFTIAEAKSCLPSDISSAEIVAGLKRLDYVRTGNSRDGFWRKRPLTRIEKLIKQSRALKIR